MNSSSKSNALAGVLRDFLPVYDRMDSLKEKYINDEFGSKYGGLSIGPTFSKMGVKDFSVQPGASIDLIRMNVVGSEYSEAVKDTVIRQVAPGMELEGNVIRAAACISSLGKEGEPALSQDSGDKSE
jgi:molecular chaperone GrpE (heat shock protein)